jgi:hypothetical protein
MDDLTALRELGSQVAPDDLEPPASLRDRVLAQATAPRTAWYRRYGRPLALLGAAAATCAVIAGTAVFADHRSDAKPATQITETPDQKVGNSSKDCTAGYTYTKSPKDLRDLLYLPPDRLTGPSQDPPSFGLDVEDCTRATAGASWFSMGDNGRVAWSLKITGPDDVNPYIQDNGLSTSLTKSLVDIDGQQGTLYYHVADAAVVDDVDEGRLYWARPDGSHWRVQAYGMTRKQIVSAVESIVIQGQTVAPDALPTGLSERVAGQSVPATLKPGMMAVFHFAAGKSGQPSLALDLNTAPTIPSAPPVGARPVDINGSTGWLSRPDSVGLVGLSWSPRVGVQAALSVEGTQAGTVALARSMRKADLSDPRLYP